MDELIKRIEEFQNRLKQLIEALRLREKNQRLDALKQEMASASFWDNAVRARDIAQEAAHLERSISFWGKARERLTDIQLIVREDLTDREITLREELEREFEQLQSDVAQKEVEVLLSGLYDQHFAIVTIYSGAGGVDAQDWAAMLERMYVRFAARHEWPVTILHRTVGQEAGIKNVTLRIAGVYAYGYLKAEAGVHRLVRLSPYDADQARHTSFAMIEVLPELEKPATIEVGKDDVRIDVFRSSGHGGQSVNTTDSAVRLTHIATGISVVCQNERSQLQNKEQAWRILLGKLEKYYHAQREEERQQLRGEFTENSWGNQIRSYVLHPYKMVKDHRTKYEARNPDDILDGNLDAFIEAELKRTNPTAQL